jgi:O-antigen/teichoic acid export membrane protein
VRAERRDGLALGALFGLAGEALVLPAGIVSTAVLTRTLGLQGYGVLGVAVAAAAPVAWAAASVVGGRTAVRLIASAERPLETAGAVVRASFWIGLAGWALFCLAAPVLARLLGRPAMTGLLMLAGADILLLPLARTHRDTLTGLGRYRAAGVGAGIQNLARLALILAAVGAGLGVAGVIGAIVAARLADIAWCRRVQAPPLRGSGGARPPRLGELVSSSFLYAACLQVFSRVDLLLLTGLGAAAAVVSRFSAAQTLSFAPGLFAMVVSPMAVAALTRAEAASGGAEAERLRAQGDLVAAVAAGGCVAVAGAAPSLARLVFGAAFAGTGPLLALLLLGGAGSVLLSLSTAQMLATGRYRAPVIVAAPMLAAAVAGHLFAIPRWGAAGAAAVTAAAALAAGIAAVLALPGPGGRRAFRLVKALACGAAGFAVAHAAGSHGLFLVDAVAGPAAALLLMYAAQVMNRADVEGFLGDLGRTGQERR